VLYSKYTVREWRQNVLQNLLPFNKNPKNRLLQLSLSLLTDRLQKVLMSRDSEKEKAKGRYLHRQSLKRLCRFCGTGMVKIVERELTSVHA